MRRVVITGLGVVTPIGIGTDRFFKAMTVGKSGIGKAVGFSTDLYRTCMVGEVTDFVDTREQWGRCSQLAVAAAAEALTDSGLLDDNSVSGEEIGVSIGTLIAEAQVLEKIDETWARSGFAAVDPDELKRFPTYSVSNNVANAFRLRGPNVMIPTACAAGNYAIAYACDQIRFGNARAMVAGGSDAISQIIYTGFNRLLSLSPDCCRPFDKNRKGLIVGEGAGMLVLEDLDNARRRGATIYAEVYGYGMTCSAYHMTAPHPEGLGAARAMGMALEQGGVDRTKIDYISAHGTGTPANDKAETQAIKKVFGSRAYEIPISSIKSMIGHSMGAASAIEAVACTLVLNHGVIPPTINYEEKDPECDLDYVPNQAREADVRFVMSNAYPFGGNDTALLLGKTREALSC